MLKRDIGSSRIPSPPLGRRNRARGLDWVNKSPYLVRGENSRGIACNPLVWLFAEGHGACLGGNLAIKPLVHVALQLLTAAIDPWNHVDEQRIVENCLHSCHQLANKVVSECPRVIEHIYPAAYDPSVSWQLLGRYI